ncbi:S1C family serine protease [Polaromonas sp. SM01]|uniref:S1C family serine protease n=1 Tax=Polaromonas sp. SM01 TaxID=3085630 RepID=UPI00298126F2|nr:S1C family serine protease [Polaromonas sp. SM01]MDW5442204.1 S1C family serine protease [Polaromonas sp. SM01]
MLTLSRWLCPLVSASLLWLTGSHAASVPPDAAQVIINALAKANAAVVGIQVTVDEDAVSAETLGQQRSGSGVVIAPDGLILTIGYLMLEAEHIEIITQDNKTLPARAVAYDLATGFGLLRPLLPLREISAVTLGSSRELQPGEPLVAMTGPKTNDDGDISMTRLISKRAFSGSWEYHIETALFTSPPVQASGGNHSGAPLFNQKGELLGIGSLLVADASGENRLLPGNMFVPVDLLRPILAELQRSGTSLKSRRPWLGLSSNDQGGRIQILRVSKDSPAARAGLAAGDVVLAVDGTTVATLEAFYKKLWDRAAPDAEIKLTVLQGAAVKTMVLKAEDRLLTLKKPSSI